MNEDVKNAMVVDCKNAIENGNVGGFVDTMAKFMEDTENRIRKDYEELKNEQDANILAARGYKALTREENDFYDSLRDRFQNTASLSNVPKALPITVFDRIFEYIKTNHPLLNEIEWLNTGTLENYIVLNTGASGNFAWGEITGTISAQISSGFDRLKVTLNKCSAWMDCSLSFLELGNTWLDKFCVETLGEGLALGLEDGTINGTGSNQPIGMIKTIAGAGETQTVPAVTKDAITVTKLNAATLGSIANTLSDGGLRTVNEILMVCSISDYLTKVMPATTYKNALGEYVVRTPLPLRICPSAKMATGKAVFGIGKNYKMCAGTGKTGRTDFSDDFRFLDDVRVYKTKAYAGGQPIDDASFVYADITNLIPDYVVIGQYEETASI